jgi:FixJ family two-component response regulator
VTDPTDDDILSDPELSRLMWEGLQAFAEDPNYFADICEDANRIDAGIAVEEPTPEPRANEGRRDARSRALRAQIAELTAKGMTVREMAAELSVDRRTIQRHRRAVAPPYQ